MCYPIIVTSGWLRKSGFSLYHSVARATRAANTEKLQTSPYCNCLSASKIQRSNYLTTFGYHRISSLFHQVIIIHSIVDNWRIFKRVLRLKVEITKNKTSTNNFKSPQCQALKHKVGQTQIRIVFFFLRLSFQNITTIVFLFSIKLFTHSSNNGNSYPQSQFFR